MIRGSFMALQCAFDLELNEGEMKVFELNALVHSDDKPAV
jgi:hypothetical protein